MMRLFPQSITFAALVSFIAMGILCAWMFSASAHIGMVSLVDCAPSAMSIIAPVPQTGALLLFIALAFIAFFCGYKSDSEAAAQGVFLFLRPPPSHRISVLRFLQELFSRGVLHPRLYSIA